MINTKFPNPEILLWTLMTSESVSSSRIEWTQTSFSDVIRYEDSLKENNKNFADIQEVVNYKKALFRYILLSYFSCKIIQSSKQISMYLLQRFYC